MSFYSIPFIILQSRVHESTIPDTRTLILILTIINKKFLAIFYATNLHEGCIQATNLHRRRKAQASRHQATIPVLILYIRLLGGLCHHRCGSGEVFLFLFLSHKILRSCARPPSLNTHHKARLRRHKIYLAVNTSSRAHNIPSRVYCFYMAIYYYHYLQICLYYR